MLDSRITRFIRRHRVMTLVVEGPWCAAVFYAWVPEREVFVYASDLQTRHASGGPQVAGAITLETRRVGRIRGIQLSGTICRTEEQWARKAYLRRFPFAAATKLELWILTPDHMKFTDNRLGFGKKLIWNK